MGISRVVQKVAVGVPLREGYFNGEVGVRNGARRAATVACLGMTGVCLAGCGGGGTTTVVRTVPPPSSSEPPPATSTSGPSAPPSPAKLNPYTDLALVRGQVFLAKYCVKELGARLGRNSPPSVQDTKLKNNAVFTLVYSVKRQPEVKTSTGKTVRELAFKGAETLRNGDCDPANAKKLENAAIDG
jgi:hypothetical protein